MRDEYHLDSDLYLQWVWVIQAIAQTWRNKIKEIFFSTDLNLPLLTPQTAIFGFLAKTDKYIFKITNYLLLIFKMYMYESPEKCSTDISRPINGIKKM